MVVFGKIIREIGDTMLNTFFVVLDNMIVLCVCMFFGFIAYKARILDDITNAGLSRILLTISLPCTIIISMQKPFTSELLAEGLIALFSFGVVVLFGAFFGHILAKFLKVGITDSGVWVTSLMLPNTVYMGYPIIQAVFGGEALFYASMAVVLFNVFAFSLGIKFITAGNKAENVSLKALLTNKAILATILGLIMFLFSIKLPSPIYNGISLVGSTTTPISMLIIGSLLARGKVSEIFSDWKIYVLTAAKLIVLPIITFFVFRNFIKNETLLGIIVILSAMPVATIVAIFAKQYEVNAELASKIVFISTILCVFTIPLISLLL